MKETTAVFRAGAGLGTIDFADGMFPLEGFWRVHDAPRVKALVFGTEDLAAIVSVDLVLLPEELIACAKERLRHALGIPPERCWVQVTHAISTPHAPDREREPEKRALYDKAVKKGLDEAIDAAAQALTPARLGVGQCVSDIIENRDIETPNGPWIGRGGYGPTNKIVHVLRFEATDGRLIALLINFAMKSAVLDNSMRREGKRHVSADAAGYACYVLGNALGGIPVVYTMSAAGDQVTQETAFYNKLDDDGSIVETDLGVESGFAMVRRIGSTLAMDVQTIVNTIECAPVEKPVQVLRAAFSWPGREPDNTGPRRAPDHRPGPERQVDVSVMRVGPVLMAACRPELNCLTELQLRAKCPAKYTLLMTMVDGGMKYMPDLRSYEENTWEAMSSPLMPGAAEKFVQTVCDLAAVLTD